MSVEVSIIIPVYNTNIEELRRCINSILDQTYENLEILIIDDGSEINIAKQIDDLKQQDIRIQVFHKKNEGVAVARNYGAAQAVGRYIMYADGDDLLTPWAIESGISAINETGADVAIGRVFKTPKQPEGYMRRNIGQQPIILDSISDIIRFEAHILTKSDKQWGKNKNGWEYNGEGCWSHLLRREIAVYYTFPRGIEVGEDTIWAVQMLERGTSVRICLVDELWYFYIQNKYSVLGHYNNRIIEQLTKPVMVLNEIFLDKEQFLYFAYLEWVLVKIQQIVYRYYLSKECSLSNFEKWKSMVQLVNREPWKAILKIRVNIGMKKIVKILLHRSGLTLILYAVKKKLGKVPDL